MPDATLYHAAAFRKQGKRGADTTTELVVESLDWLAGNDVQVINLSFGGPRNLILELVISRLLDRRLVIVAAAGNGGKKGERTYPAAQEGVIAVTAIDARERLYRRATVGSFVDFSAPGVDIWAAAADGKGKYYSGTSFAAPFVAAIAAVHKDSPQDLSDRLRDSAVDLGEPGKDDRFGWGLVRFANSCAETELTP